MTAATGEEEPGALHLVGPQEALQTVASAMVGSMPLERRAIFALALSQKLSYPEIARRLGLSEDAIKHHLREGLASVRRDVLAQLAVLGGPRSPAPPTRAGDTMTVSS